MTTPRGLPTTEKRPPRRENIDERSTLVQGIIAGGRRAWNLLDRAEGRVTPVLVMHFRRVDLDGALEILKEHRQLLCPAITKSSERI